MIQIQNVEYLLTTEVAERFGVHPHTVRRWCECGELDGVVDRGKNVKPRYFIPAEAVEGFVPPSWGGSGWQAGRKRA